MAKKNLSVTDTPIKTKLHHLSEKGTQKCRTYVRAIKDFRSTLGYSRSVVSKISKRARVDRKRNSNQSCSNNEARSKIGQFTSMVLKKAVNFACHKEIKSMLAVAGGAVAICTIVSLLLNNYNGCENHREEIERLKQVVSDVLHSLSTLSQNSKDLSGTMVMDYMDNHLLDDLRMRMFESPSIRYDQR